MHIYFYFYATIVNSLVGFYTPQIIHMGLKNYDAVKQTNIYFIF